MFNNLFLRNPLPTKTFAETVFSPFAYTGTGSTQTIINGIDLATNGGAVWLKRRNSAGDHSFYDTNRGVRYYLKVNSNDESQQSPAGTGLIGFNSTGFTLGSDWNQDNSNGDSFISYTFRKAAGFFDIQSYSGTGGSRSLSHALGVAPGIVIVKTTSANPTYPFWQVYAQTDGGGIAPRGMVLNDPTGPAVTNTNVGTAYVSSSVVNLSNIWTFANVSGESYICYLFASMPGVSKIGIYNGNGSSLTVDCGFTTSARFVMIKRSDSSGDWYIWDIARGITASSDPHISANRSLAEVGNVNSVSPQSSGFGVVQNATTNINVNGASYLYLAIA